MSLLFSVSGQSLGQVVGSIGMVRALFQGQLKIENSFVITAFVSKPVKNNK